MIQILIAIFTLIAGLTIYPDYARAGSSPLPACKLSPVEQKLDKDLRDYNRLECLDKVRSRISVKSCQLIAQSLEYSKNSDMAKLSCIDGAKHQATLKECQSLAQSILNPDLADEARWLCLTSYTKVLDKKTCRRLAAAMAFPAHQERAQYFCLHENRK